MRIRTKMFLPFAVAVLVLGCGGVFVVERSLEGIEDKFVSQIAVGKAGELENAVRSASRLALEQVALFTALPAVQQAYREALTGNTADETDPAVQNARQRLRRDLAPLLEGFARTFEGRKLMVHFHLQNARSLVRLWRDKQITRNGQKLDVSDDLSGFRPTVLEVNRTGKPVTGIELGEGGFVIRALAPVTGPDRERLGSVEVLVEFDPLLAGMASGGQEMLLYMNAEFLGVTAALRDPARHPVLDGRFVQVSGAKDKALEQLVTPALLTRGQKGLAVENRRDVALAAFPVKDFQGAQAGVVVAVVNTSEETALMNKVLMTFAGVLVVLLGALAAIGRVLVGRFVERPVSAVVAKIQAITEDRADLCDRLPEDSGDEMAELSRWFNALTAKLGQILNLSEAVLNAVPDPLFVVDKDMRILLANKATGQAAGVAVSSLKGRACADVMGADACGNELCPIARLRAGQNPDTGSPIACRKAGQTRWIKPFADEVRDAQGGFLGYLELAGDVTAAVEHETRLTRHLEELQQMHQDLNAVAGEITRSLSGVSGNVAEVSNGALVQKTRMEETLVAMDQLSRATGEVSASADKAASQAEEARTAAQEGEQAVSRAASVIGEVKIQAQSLRESMGQLGLRVQDIGRILTVISDIADQTNLLALNAAIESARAGEAGRGFAVVADEVRKLAEKTVRATAEVSTVIESIRQEARRGQEQIDQAVRTAEEASSLSVVSGQALMRIVDLSVNTSGQVEAIAGASRQQAAASDHIRSALEGAHAVSQSTASGMEVSARSLEGLGMLTQRLRSIASLQ